MTVSKTTRRVLIASANPLFREGLHKVYAHRWGERAEVVASASNMPETLHALETFQPDLVIIDYDDTSMSREEFLNQFMHGHAPMQVVLVSLNESGRVVVYDRRNMTPAQAEDWLSNPWQSDPA
jgi:cytochrome c oxidase subunit II